jgi:hypothetical protein
VTYYLFRIKDSVMHKQKKLWYRLQTLVLGTMSVASYLFEWTLMSRLPPVIATFMLVITQRKGSSKSNVGMLPEPLIRDADP